MSCTSISESLKALSVRALNRSLLVALLLAVTILSVAPAHAQSNDAWKSVAIIGGSTAAGAYIGHKVAGTPGAYVGAAIGASAGYAIDQRRRQNEYYNQYPSGDGGYYPDNGSYNGNAYPSRGNGGYNGDPNAYPYASRYQGRYR